MRSLLVMLRQTCYVIICKRPTNPWQWYHAGNVARRRRRQARIHARRGWDWLTRGPRLLFGSLSDDPRLSY